MNIFFRISSLVEKLCTNYGDKICEINGASYYSFPEVEQLADPKVNKSQSLKFQIKPGVLT